MKNTGGPAFPDFRINLKHKPTHDGLCTTEEEHFISTNGMTLRDYLATKAMAGLLSNRDYHAFDDSKDLSKEHLAKSSYMMADAMLAEREKGGSK